MSKKTILLSTAAALHACHAELIRIHLLPDLARHDEAWGALSAANAAVEKCCQIAARDVQRQSPVPTPLVVTRRSR